MKNWLASVGSNASYQSVASSIGQAVNTGAAAVKAAVKEERTVAQPDRHHVRLSLESAKRLRWIESEEVSALVRRHAQEKNLLGECVTAMRKFLLQKGFQENDMDAEVQALLNEAREIDINDQDVATVLLVSAQDELTELRSKVAFYESQGPSMPPTHASFDAGSSHPELSAPVTDSGAFKSGAVSSNASYTTLPMPPMPPAAAAAAQVTSSSHAVTSPSHGALSPRQSLSDPNAPVQLLLTVEPARTHEGEEKVRCTIAPAPRKALEGSRTSVQSAPHASTTIAQQAAHLQDLLAQQNAIYSELLALKPAIMSAQIAASGTIPNAPACAPTVTTPFTTTPARSPPVFTTAKSAGDSKGEPAEPKLFGSGTLSPLTLSFQTGGAPENVPEGSPSKMLEPHASAVAAGSAVHSTSPPQIPPVLSSPELSDKGANGMHDMTSTLQGVEGGSSTPDGTCIAPPPRLVISQAASLDSGVSELKFGSPRTSSQATADLQPMLARLGELEQQRRRCLEATTDATAAIIAAASTAAAPPVATSELSRVRELEGHVAQLRSALRRATTDGTPDGKGARSPAIDGGASPVKGDAGSGPDHQGSQGVDKKAVDAKSALAATQVQLRMARQLVLSEQDRANHAEKRAERLEVRCRRLQAEFEAASAKLKAAETRATEAGTAAAARNSDAVAEREAELSALRAAQRSAQRDAAQAAAAAERAERREAAALAQVASLETIAEEKGWLEAQVAALQGRVDDAAAERRRAEHFREMAETLEAKVEAHMQESVQAAQAAADAESRTASMHDSMMRALRDQQAAEARTAQLECKIQEEVNEARDALKHAEGEAEAAQERVKTLQKDIQVVHAQQAAFHAARQQASPQQDVASSGIHMEALRAEAERAQARLEKQLQRLEKELSACQNAKRQLEAEVAMSIHGANASRTQSGVPGAIIGTTESHHRASSGSYWGQGLIPGMAPTSPSSQTPLHSPRGSITNFSVAQNANSLAAAAAAVATATTDVSISLDELKRASNKPDVEPKTGVTWGKSEPPIDVPYLKKLLMKLLEVIAAGKTNERDALLPIIGMLVGASPGECDSLKQLFVSKSLW